MGNWLRGRGIDHTKGRKGRAGAGMAFFHFLFFYNVF